MKKKKRNKKKKIKKLYPDFPHVGSLIPLNLDEERNIFFTNNEKYNPIFQYASQNAKLTLNKPDIRYLTIAKKILEAALKHYGSHKNFVNSGGNIISKKDTSIFIDNYLKDTGLSDKVSYIFMKNRISSTSVIHRHDGKTEIIIREPIKYRKNKILGVLNHEIGTHCVRKHNDIIQCWYKKRKKFKMGKFLNIEEGLGCLNKFYETALSNDNKPFLYDAALNYLAAYWASKMSFEQLFQELKIYAKDKEKLWRICLRVKRGLIFTQEKGGMYKDQLYLQGAIEVLKKRRSINFLDLYSGKLNLSDCKRLSEKKLIKQNSLCIPYFLRDMGKYLKALDIIAQTNFIEQISQFIIQTQQ